MVCATCGQENPEGFRFCGACGAPLAGEAREERKVVTALFCDLVGFTQRAEQLDPEDVRALVTPYWDHVRTELERYGGTVDKFIGDAVMALFGAPVAHEDDPERAVRAALAIRDWAREQDDVQIRIGVATGEALVRVDADAASGKGMALGDVVNTAARLQTAAPVNGIVVGESTWRATEQAIQYEERDPVVAKGKAQPVPVWEPLQAKSRLGVDVVQQSRTPLVGRKRELDALLDALERAHEGRTVQLVTLVGVPGIGKSRLVYEVALAQRELVTWRQGRSLPYGDGVAMWALGEMVKAEANIYETDTPEQAEAKLAATTDDEWALRHLRTLVGIAEDRAASRDEAFAAWREYLETLAERRPIVLVFEDLHWADDTLLDFVDHLVDYADDVPMLVLATARPELLHRRPRWGGGKRNATTLSLDPLDEQETTELARSLVDWSALPEPTRAAVLERAEGNPLYTEQFVRGLSEHVDPSLPETIQGIIAARLDSLPAEEKEQLQNAAVLGKVFWTGALETVGGVSRADADALLHSLVRKEFVRRERRPSLVHENEWSFRHVLTCDVAYSQIPRAARADKHLRAADWIETLGRAEDHAQMLAYHCGAALEYARAAGHTTPELEVRTRRALRDAGERAFVLNAFAAAAHNFEAALELWPQDDGDRPRLLLRLALSQYVVGHADRETGLELARDELLAVGDREGAAEAEARLSELWWHRGKRDVARGHLDRAQELVADAPASVAKTRVLAEVSRYQMLADDLRQAIESARQALAIAEELGLVELQAHALNNIGMARHGLGDEEGVADIERSIELALTVNSPEAARGRHNLAACVVDTDFLRSRELFAEAVRVGERLGNPDTVRYSRGCIIDQHSHAGEWEEFVPLADEFIAACEAGEPSYYEATIRADRALMRLARGDDVGALDDVRKALELARAAGDAQAVLPTLSDAIFIETELQTGRQAALATEMAAALHDRQGKPYMILSAGLVADQLGLADALREWIAQHPHGRDSYPGILLNGGAAALATAAEAEGLRPLAAQAHLRAAEQLAAEGRPAEADTHARAALEFYRSVGATRYVERLEPLLAATA